MIRSIQDRTGVYIAVSKDAPADGRPVRVLTLKGSESQIAAGEAEVQRVVEMGDRSGYGGPPGAGGGFGGGGGGGGGGFDGRRGGPGLGYGGGGDRHEESMQILASTIGVVVGRGGHKQYRHTHVGSCAGGFVLMCLSAVFRCDCAVR